MPEGCPIGGCSELAIADCCAKAVSLDDPAGGLHASEELKSKFGSLRRCDYYLVAKGGEVLVLIEKTDLAKSIEALRDEYSQKLQRAFQGMPEGYMEAVNKTVYRELVYNKICEEHREKALATLYILEHMRQDDAKLNLRGVLKYKSVLYVLLVTDAPDKEYAEIIPMIGNAVKQSLIKEPDFHFIEEKDFCKYMVDNKIV